MSASAANGRAPVVKEMGMTREDFLRGLPFALNGYDYGLEGDRAVVGTPGRGLSVSFEALEPRRIGPTFATPRARITIAFADLDPSLEAEFLKQFDRAYQRGGG